MDVYERLEELEVSYEDWVVKVSEIQLKIKKLKLKHYEDELGIKEGVLVLTHGKNIAMVDSIQYRRGAKLNERPWIKVRTKNKNGDFSKKVIHAFDNWELLVLESEVNKQ